METSIDSFKLWVTFDEDGDNYIWVQPFNGDGYWEGDQPSNVPEEFYTKLDSMYNLAFN